MYFKLLLLCVALPDTGALLFYGGKLRNDVTSDAERIAIRHIDSVHDRNKRSAVTMPLSLVLALEDSTGSRALNLTRGRDHSQLDVFTDHQGEWRKKNIKQNLDRAVYFEKKSGSTLIVERLDLNKYIVAGYVVNEAGAHDIWPAHRHRRNEVDGVVSADHIIKQVQRIDFGPIHSHHESIQREVLATTRHKRSAVIQRTVELCFFSDFSDYSRFLVLNGGDMNAAIADMQVYYGFCEQAVRCIYASLPTDRICIDIQVKKLRIFTTAGEPAWVSEANIPQGGLTHNAEIILDKMTGINSSALTPASDQLPGCDHWMLFTDTIPYGLDNMNNPIPIVGVAAFEGLCKNNGVSLTKNTQTLCTCITAAHELGHSQGLQHDIDVGCPDVDGFIMATSVFVPNDTNPGNFFTFSSCSVDGLVAFYSSEGGCSVETNVTMDMFNETEAGQFPGQVYNADEQCRRNRDGSILCREEMNSTGITDFCRRIRCGDDPNNCYDLVPFDQTSCGNKKWCVKGFCVFNESAPARSESCPFGDDPNTVCTPQTCVSQGSKCCETCNPPPTEPPTTEATDSTTDATVTDSTGTDATVTDSTATDATVTDSTATDATATDGTATDATVTDSTATDATVTDSTATNATVTDSTATDATVTDSTATDATVTDSTATDATVTDSTATDETATDATATDATATDATTTAPPGAQPGDVLSTQIFIIESC